MSALSRPPPPVDGLLADAGFLGDALDRELVVAQLLEHLRGRGQDGFAGRGAANRSGSMLVHGSRLTPRESDETVRMIKRDFEETSMAALLYRLGSFAARRAWQVIVAWVLILGLSIGAFLAFGGSLSNSFDIPGTASGAVVDELTQELPDSAGMTASVVYQTDDGSPFTDEQKQAISDVAAGAEDLDDIASVIDPFDAQQQQADGAQQLADAQTQIDDGRAQLDAGQAQLDAGKAQLDAAQAQLTAARTQAEAAGAPARAARRARPAAGAAGRADRGAAGAAGHAGCLARRTRRQGRAGRAGLDARRAVRRNRRGVRGRIDRDRQRHLHRDPAGAARRREADDDRSLRVPAHRRRLGLLRIGTRPGRSRAVRHRRGDRPDLRGASCSS